MTGYRLLRSIGFRFDPETAHHLALRALRLGRPLRRGNPVSEPIEVFGLRFPNRVGLAAGYDKDATAWRALAGLGFGHIEIGTVTPLPQPGHPRPRVHRFPDREALINRMGFPSDGAEAVAARLGSDRPHDVVVGVSIGPNAATPPDERIADYLTLVDRFRGLADYLAINVSSPNTAGLRELEGAPLQELLAAVRERAASTPVVVKLSPDIADPEEAAGAAERAGVAGVIVGNTTLTRPGFEGDTPPGGLSGAPLRPLALETLRRVAAATRLPLIACGGIMSAADAAERFEAGASLVQLYTGLVYRGPRLVTEVAGSSQLSADS
ncbi:MAG TPA: quinone-dependent dihydroorotate dehydrogenase [Acidimicrobiia bacterium]|nr:quinone-dependent dihydroorotate dehydrogenase [Acidimicrobiia bacterium]